MTAAFRRRAAGAGLACAVALAGSVAHAQVFRLDDSASPRPHVPALQAVDEQGRPLDASPFARRAVLRFGRVDYVLATAPYIGRRGRVMLVVGMPPDLLRPDGLRLEWRGIDRFESGSARAGERRLLWAGTVTERQLRGTVDLTATMEFTAWRLAQNGAVNFETHFEIELLP